jgi:DNA-binding MarR family transcriptional regulator
MTTAQVQLDPTAIDRLVHEPARMAVLSVLDGVADVDFASLQRLLGVTAGNLWAHLAKLEAGGLVTATKASVPDGPRTTLAITASGRQARVRHWAQLERIWGLGRPSA